ncbi:MAG: putative ATP-dependent helicase [Ilumatobacteraceae bacterium]|nr:putative ATP-dependent helicase [Ilumatobacteraceae bacterium]
MATEPPPEQLPVEPLPVETVIGDVADALDRSGSAVLVAPPGAGKTTLVPLRLVDLPWMRGQKIVMLEPRRLAARAAGHRMAHLLGEDVGDTVGYQTRDERRIGRSTRIEVVTEGVLTRRLQHDPELPGTGLVIFDEVHERNLPTDVGLALALDARRTLRPDLKILAMSATAQAESLAKTLGGDAGPCPIVTSDGRTYPIDIRWSPPGKGQKLDQAVAETVLLALRNDIGDVLVFLPGIGEITRVYQALDRAVPGNVDLYPLAGALSLSDQDRALAPSPPGRRRVVLSTDIAETSLTVAGVRIVVDAGQARVPRYDIRTGMTRLTTIATSRASADQRAGRAGRTEPGIAYRMWSKLEHSTRRAHLEAEITQVDLAGLALELAAWGTPADQLDFPDPPPARTLAQGAELLRLLGAFDEHDAITATGRAMLSVPAHPRLARMVVDAVGPADQGLACVLAALLDDRDILRGRADDLPADIALRLRVVIGTERHERADRGAVDRLVRRARDIAGRVGVKLDLDAIDPDRAGPVLLRAYPDRLAVRRSQPGQFQLRTGSGAWVAKDDPLADEPFVVAADVDGDRKNTRLRLAAGIDAEEVADTLGDVVETRTALVWDKDRGDIVERMERRLGNMRLDERVRRPGSGDATTAALIERVRVTRLAPLGWGPAATQLRRRVEFLHRSAAGVWPDWSDGALVKTLDDWLAPYLGGMTSINDVAALDLTMVLRAGLPWPLGAQVDELAPTQLELASGRTVTLDYSGDQPAASVRVQDLFGTKEHPVAAGMPVLLHLLSPADRPIQITADLPGFWAGSWTDVRKDMAGRYPKHQWPTDPANAPPKRMNRPGRD